MKLLWLKKASLDIIITIFILLTLVIKYPLFKYFLYMYTILMVVSRIVALTNLSINKTKTTSVPDWFFHILYAINVLVLLIDRWWILAALWICIWALAFLYTKKPKKEKPRRRIKYN